MYTYYTLVRYNFGVTNLFDFIFYQYVLFYVQKITCTNLLGIVVTFKKIYNFEIKIIDEII